MTETVPSTLEVLRAARELISEPARFTTGCSARDAQGQTMTAVSPLAVCWCVWGAIWKVGGAGITNDIGAPLARVMVAAGLDPKGTLTSLFDWSDTHTHAQVLAALDSAIASEMVA